ncbi:MAG: tetratricopeptide repeat protein [Patescibacteria group bacterium]|nr:tetratricopeptide repeat protein [Patescibacteria group bacterium]
MFEIIIVVLLGSLLGLIFYRRYKSLGEGHAVESVPSPLPEPNKDLENFIWRAERYVSTGNLEEAEKFLIQALALDDAHEDVLSKLGIIYIQKEMPIKAEPLFSKLVVIAPSNPVYHSNLGLCLYHQSRFEEAKAAYEKALEFDRSRAGRFISLAHVLRELGKVEEAVRHVKQATVLEKENKDYYLFLADLYKELGMMKELDSVLEKIESFN